MEAKSPVQTLEFTSNVSVAKVSRPLPAEFILAFFAGVYIAFGAQGSNMAAFNLLSDPAAYGLGRVLSGCIFSAGLMIVLVAGAELFTGNNLIIVGVLDKKVTVRKMLFNWLVVYIGNFAGSILIARMLSGSGLFSSGSNLLGAMTIKIAAGKCALNFAPAFMLGVLCNWLVCLAVWVSFAAPDVIGKFFACFFLICLFVTSGFEHSVANMYYVPAGLFAAQNPVLAEAAKGAGANIGALTWGNFFVKNLFPVTLGNIAGGALCVGTLYFLSLKKLVPVKKPAN